jgi:hypothetical protein
LLDLLKFYDRMAIERELAPSTITTGERVKTGIQKFAANATRGSVE